MKTLLALACMCLFACEQNDFNKHSTVVDYSVYGDAHRAVEITVHCRHSTMDKCNAYLKLHCMNPDVLSSDEDNDEEIMLQASCLK